MTYASTMPQPRTKEPWLAGMKAKVGEFFTDIGKHQVLMMAGSIAYTTALSLAPFVLIILAVASLVGQSFQNQIYSQITSLLGGEAGDAVRLVVENADNNQGLSTVSGIVGFLILAISASAIFAQLRTSLDIINETEVRSEGNAIWGFIRDRFLSVGLVLGFVFLAITSLAVSTVIAGIFQDGEAALWTAVAFVTNLVIFCLLFTVMFHFIPTERDSWKHSLISGVCATVFFLIGKHLIGLYLGRASVGSAYGAAGTLVVFLVWVYYTTLTLLVSYEFANNILIDRDKPEAV